MDEMGFQVPVGHKDRGEILEQQVLGVPLAQGVVVWSTRGGGKLAVQMSQELSWCMQGGLVELITHTQGRSSQPPLHA